MSKHVLFLSLAVFLCAAPARTQTTRREGSSDRTRTIGREKEWTVATAPPVVVSTVPAAGATDVDPMLSEIRVTFSKTMLDANWSWDRVSEATFPARTRTPHYQPDGKTCVLPVTLEPGKDYVIWVNSEKFRGFQDRNKVPALPYLLVFRTRAR